MGEASSLAVKVIFLTLVVGIFMVVEFDAYINRAMMTSEFNANRSATQGSLYDLQDKYNEHEELTSVEMLNSWIINFVDTHSIKYEKVELLFHKIETDPPVYMVTVKGFENDYAYLDKQAYFEYLSSATIITDEIDLEIEHLEEVEEFENE